MRPAPLVLLLAHLLLMPNQANAGEFSYRCAYLAGPLTCKQISDQAANEITDIFTNTYPASRFQIIFSVHTRFVDADGIQTWFVNASLHRLGTNTDFAQFPALAAHAANGYDRGNPNYARQRANLAQAAQEATRALVSDLMNR